MKADTVFAAVGNTKNPWVMGDLGQSKLVTTVAVQARLDGDCQYRLIFENSCSGTPVPGQKYVNAAGGEGTKVGVSDTPCSTVVGQEGCESGAFTLCKLIDTFPDPDWDTATKFVTAGT